MFASSRENPERTFDLVLKVKCQASENEGNVPCLLIFIYRNERWKKNSLHPDLLSSYVLNCCWIRIVLESDYGYFIAFKKSINVLIHSCHGFLLLYFHFGYCKSIFVLREILAKLRLEMHLLQFLSLKVLIFV